MAQQFTISKTEFNNLHNGMCDLRRGLLRLDEVLSSNLMADIRRGVDMLEFGLAGVRSQESAALEASMQCARDLDEELDLKIATISIFDVNYDSIPFPEATTLMYQTSTGSFSIPIQTNSTYKDLFKAADSIIDLSGDRHHTFIEDFTSNAGTFVTLSTGS